MTVPARRFDADFDSYHDTDDGAVTVTEDGTEDVDGDR